MDEARVNEILAEMTIEEKAALCSGLDFWHTKPNKRLKVPSVMMTDGPHGMRKEDDTDKSVGMKRSIPATCFPPAVTCACTWNPDLLKEMGAHIADEARAQGVVTVLGPGTNIKRSPKGGRNFEYYSEDPYLAGQLAAAYIAGVQGKGIGTSLKHFAVNSQEYLRMSISEVVDERTLREIYLPAFENAVKQTQPATVMCSYNRINGTYASENKYLLTDILRDEWGFEGIVVSDWGATSDRVKGMEAGLDLEMPSSFGYNDKKIAEAVKDGSLKEEVLDKVAKRMLTYILKYSEQITPDFEYDYEKSHRLARRIAAEGAVLLKNEGGLLPLRKGEKVAILGALAKESRYQGAGSSLIVPKHLVHLPEVLDAAGQPYDYANGYSLKGDGMDEALIKEAVEVAKKNDKVVVFAGLTANYESEGFDRSNLDIPAGHTALIEAVRKVNENIVVVLVGGAPVLTPWADDVPAILNAYLAGEAAGEAYYDVLWGDVNPSGKLAETYPMADEGLSDKYFQQGPRTVEHREGLYVGYRYYDSAKKAVRFPFGHGLSYTTFAYSDLKTSAKTATEDEGVDVTFRVTNTGKTDGSEIAQVYVTDEVSTAYRPQQELKGFCKVFLKAGESKEVTIHLDKRSFAYYNVNEKDWVVESGVFVLSVGASSRDIRLTEKVTVIGRDGVKQDDRKGDLPAYYDIAGVDAIPDEQFRALLGFDIPDNTPLKKGEFDMCSTVRDLKATRFGRAFAKVGVKALKGTVKDGDMTTMMMMEAGFLDVPIRNFVGMSSGIVTHKVAEGVVERANGHFFKGWGHILSGVPHAIKALTKK